MREADPAFVKQLEERNQLSTFVKGLLEEEEEKKQKEKKEWEEAQRIADEHDAAEEAKAKASQAQELQEEEEFKRIVAKVKMDPYAVQMQSRNAWKSLGTAFGQIALGITTEAGVETGFEQKSVRSTDRRFQEQDNLKVFGISCRDSQFPKEVNKLNTLTPDEKKQLIAAFNKRNK